MSADDPGAKATTASQEVRLAAVDRHVEEENRRDLDGIVGTFADDAWYEDEARGRRHDGQDGVRTYYEDLLRALPDLHIDVQRRHITENGVILESTVTGTHDGNWDGLAGTGRHIEFSVCSIFEFDDRDQLVGERIYYDRASVLRQLGIFRDPDSGLGQVLAVVNHPATIARAFARALRRD